MPKYVIKSPVIHEGLIIESGEIELEEKQAERLVELGYVQEKKPKRKEPPTDPETPPTE